MESHRLHGYQPRCPELFWDNGQGRYLCRLAKDPVHGETFRRALLIGKGCCAPLNPWREEARNRENTSDK
ncbi:MAG TPA: hypothetical protein ENN39_09385 [Desulfonatronum sp.]|nr:hypothetical protein [Desulfonatronum sp.]